MNILYGIQGTGHGHISRARELVPELSKHASVDILISGYACKIGLDNPVRFRKHGISLTYDSNGGVSILNTLRDLRPIRFIYDIKSVPLKNYDLVISDYEPVCAWAAKLEGIPSLALSHQAAFLSDKSPRPAHKSLMAESILQYFAPTDKAIGFHFERYDDFIEPPIIRSQIRSLTPARGNHVTVYLPAYHHTKLVKLLQVFPEVNWHIFSPDCSKSYQRGNIFVNPVSNNTFLKSFEECLGVITGAGFETSAEAMYLNKKLLVVPIRNQYEQLCNAAALKKIGVSVLDSLEGKKQEIGEWLGNKRTVANKKVADPEKVVQKILAMTGKIKETQKPEKVSA